MNPNKATRICLWGGFATILAGILLIVIGLVITETAPLYPYGTPRGLPASLAGILFVIIGFLMILCGATIKALGLENRPRPEHETTDHDGNPT